MPPALDPLQQRWRCSVPDNGRRSYDPFDYHDPTSGVGGAPPARSALGLRLVLAIFGLVTCIAGAIASALVGLAALAVVLAVLAGVALVDIVVVSRRVRVERRMQR